MPFLSIRHCPICTEDFEQFDPAGIDHRPDRQCPSCRSVERHRLVWIYFNAKTDLLQNARKKLLHVAPERCLSRTLETKLGDNYITSDLNDPRVKVRMDITDIQYPDNYFDAIYCSHVLEHVPQDRKAITEFYRTLKPGGWAMLLVPMGPEPTEEDPTIVDPDERLLRFGHPDHVRMYGPDFITRFEEAGFEVETSQASDYCDADQIVRFGLNHSGLLTVGRKQI